MSQFQLDTIYNEDCLQGMQRIPDGSVDMVLCDLPYGTTQLEWDVCLPLERLWEQWLRVCKVNAAIVLFSAQPFTTDLINSNRKLFKYEIIWEKTLPTGFYNAKKRPLKIHENILVFYRKQPVYNPLKIYKPEKATNRIIMNSASKIKDGNFVGKVNQESYNQWNYICDGTRYPTDIIQFSNWSGALFGNVDRNIKHPTNKPVELCEYLIKTYTYEGDTVLDNCMGSGTTAIACIKEKRHFVGFELNKEYFDYACNRIKAEQSNLTLF